MTVDFKTYFNSKSIKNDKNQQKVNLYTNMLIATSSCEKTSNCDKVYYLYEDCKSLARDLYAKAI